MSKQIIELILALALIALVLISMTAFGAWLYQGA